MARWEYKIVLRSRFFRGALGWSDWSLDITQSLAELGDQGWELVAIEPRVEDPGTNVDGHWAALTTCDVWVFKRPKPEG